MESPKNRKGQLYYFRVPDNWTKAEKLDFLSKHALKTVEWRQLQPNRKHTWLVSDTEAEFESHTPIGSKEAKRAKTDKAETIFKTYSNGAKTNRDSYVYDYEYDPLAKRMRQFVQDYNVQVATYQQQTPKPEVDDFVDYDLLKWDGTLKADLGKENYGAFNIDCLRTSLYRPFTKKHLYFDSLFINSVYRQPYFFPNQQAEAENRGICLTDKGSEKPFMVLMTQTIPDLHIVGPGASAQCFPFYTYDEDGDNRQENITDWALAQFRGRYGDPTISKWDIFHYVYALLHHPGWRSRYAADLKRQLPRIPFAPDFQPFREAGARLAGLHLDYETAERYELAWQTAKKPISYRVDKMLPKNKHKSEAGYTVYDSLKVNGSLTLHDIPERAFAYRLGSRSALDWIVDQYRVKTDKRSGITHNPNGYSDDEQYILKLIERVVWVSLRTVETVNELAEIPFA